MFRKKVSVFNLSTGDSVEFVGLSAEGALISAVIIDSPEFSMFSVADPAVRARIRQDIVRSVSGQTLGYKDLCCFTDAYAKERESRGLACAAS